ncbi:RDD family protein [Roseibacillus persicicus]|uniref:RDD domain-containing protein n=1 Tax=Roseibacillus persicicus TaxID=454148 RepID=A0A918TS23_9BACT|nr:RDD family protein [Roseibacillus persicicus]GHC58486.1 hypothetical protein GCM10007100_26870 [Roseibacillus persicicus]
MNSSGSHPTSIPNPVYPRASGEKRLLNFFIDFTVCSALTLGLEVGAHLFASSFNAIWSGAFLATWSPLALVLIAFTYYFVMELLARRTLGKILTNTLVESIEGTKPSLAQINIRTLARFIPFELFTFLGPTGEGLHDALSNTRVVDTSKPAVFFKSKEYSSPKINPAEGKPIPIREG